MMVLVAYERTNQLSHPYLHLSLAKTRTVKTKMQTTNSDLTSDADISE
jgi:hypothetical protein